MSLLFVALALLRGLVYAAVIPPWQAPDEHGHFEYAWLVSQHGPGVGPEAISPQLQRAVLASMAEFDFWRFTHQPTPAELPDGFLDPQQALLSKSRPQVGDERPIYYWLVGGLLRALGTPDVLTSLYIGRFVSVALFAAAVGLTAYGARALFPGSIFMEVLPPAFVLSLPMLGQMGSAFHSDALGVLTGTLFFVTLIPVFRDGLTWRRGVAVIGALGLALLSKKTTLFLLPTGVVAVFLYAWVRGVHVGRRAAWVFGSGLIFLVLLIVALAVVPADTAANWVVSDGCGPTRLEGYGVAGEASLRVGPCPNSSQRQNLAPEVLPTVQGRSVTLTGWVRSAGEEGMGRISVLDGEHNTELAVTGTPDWEPFTLTHPVSPDARRVGVDLTWVGGSGLFFDELALSTEGSGNLLVNGSAEIQGRLVSVLTPVLRAANVPTRMVEMVLSPTSWDAEARRTYVRGAQFCFRSFWGNFGWLAVPLPDGWYAVLGGICLLALAGGARSLVSGLTRDWNVGYMVLVAGGVGLLVVQTLLPLISLRISYWLPQGRYLLVGLFPIALGIAGGLFSLIPQRWERPALLLGASAIFGFDLLCLGLFIVPYFW
jgi:hypothetical protein